MKKGFLRAAALAACLFQGTALGAADDADVERSVEDRLKIDPRVAVEGLDVDSVDGAVRLSGTVDTLLDKEQAGEIAGRAKGARSVDNRIHVRTFRLPDSAIREDVERSMLVIPRVDRERVKIGVEDGVAVLTGAAESEEKKDWFGGAAKKVKGVREVRNHIVVP